MPWPLFLHWFQSNRRFSVGVLRLSLCLTLFQGVPLYSHWLYGMTHRQKRCSNSKCCKLLFRSKSTHCWLQVLWEYTFRWFPLRLTSLYSMLYFYYSTKKGWLIAPLKWKKYARQSLNLYFSVSSGPCGINSTSTITADFTNKYHAKTKCTERVYSKYSGMWNGKQIFLQTIYK